MRETALCKEDYEEVKQRLSMQQVAEFYGCPVDRRGNCRCPFHDDAHPSMKIYPHDKGYYCFTCGEGGDVVKFVARLYGLGNADACRKLIGDFSLPIKLDGLGYREQREQDLRIRRRKELDGFVRYAAGILSLYRIRLCEALRDPCSAHFVEAAQNIAKTEYRLSCLKEYPQEFHADRKAVQWVGTVEQRLIEWDEKAPEVGAIPGRNLLPDLRD